MKRKPKGRKRKSETLKDNFLKVIVQYMKGKGYTPLTPAQLKKKLNIPAQHAQLFRRAIEKLTQEGKVLKKEGRLSLGDRPKEVVSGIIRVHPRGFGFVQPDKSSLYLTDIFIPKHFTYHAVDGDFVEVAVNLQSISEKGPEGRVIGIIERARSHVAGIIKYVEIDGDAIAYVPLMGKKKQVIVETQEGDQLRAGDRVIMEVLDWGSDRKETRCRFSHALGHINDASADVVAAIEEYELRADFPVAVIKEAQSFGTRVTSAQFQDREDLKRLKTCTIDPDTAKDFDDALSLEKDRKGNFYLWVHIADVTHYIKPGSQLDQEAALRCNSTYFPNYCLSMLPESLSNNLCSLRPNVNRLTVSVYMHFEKTGELVDYRIVRAVIKSKKRFTYREAKRVLDGKLTSPHKKMLSEMVELCHLLKRKRAERGSIEFSIPELVVTVDEKGNPTGTDFIEYDITHQLVEEFMLKANEVVAWHLFNEGKDLTYRVHEEPSEEDMKDFSLLAAAFGHKLSDKPTVEELQELFDEVQHAQYGPYLTTSFIRRMRMATYSPENIGHYGLALKHYCHFTSPIRRYVDIAIHRLLFNENVDYDKLHQIGVRCSEQERVSGRAENSVILLKKLRLLKEMTKKSSHKSFDAVVTRLKPFGFFFELLDIMLEGFLYLSDLENDFFVFEERRMRLKGRYSGTVYQPASKITVVLKNIDLINLETDWYLIP